MVVKRAFKVDATAPKITLKTPVGQDISVVSRIQITFSEEMQKESVEVSIDGYSGTIIWLENSLIFTPDEKLEYSTRYVVKVTCMDLYNNSIGDYQWDFQTESEPKTSESESDQDIIWACVLVAVICISAVISLIIIYKKKGQRK
jgi:hypothetical protein